MPSDTRARLAALLLSTSAFLGCSTTPADARSSATADQKLGQPGGTAIEAEGAFTCDFALPGSLPLAQVPAVIERDRMYMAERPGMLTKRLPIAMDPGTGNLFSGRSPPARAPGPRRRPP